MRNSVKILLLNVIPPEQSAWQRALSQAWHFSRRWMENVIMDLIYLGGYFVELLGRAKTPAAQSIHELNHHFRHIHIRQDRLLKVIGAAFVLFALLY